MTEAEKLLVSKNKQIAQLEDDVKKYKFLYLQKVDQVSYLKGKRKNYNKT